MAGMYTPTLTLTPNSVLILEQVLGHASEEHIARALHEVGHRGGIEHLKLSPADTQRHRLRAVTDRGTQCAIALPRSQGLSDGAVLFLRKDRAVVVHMEQEQWLELLPGNSATALELGYLAGNMHWKVEFNEGHLRVLLQGPRQDYLQRLAPFLEQGRVVEV